jgi:hypothetical protein
VEIIALSSSSSSLSSSSSSSTTNVFVPGGSGTAIHKKK